MQLSTNDITVSDVDTPPKDLLIWLVSPPKYGFIENTRTGEKCLCDGMQIFCVWSLLQETELTLAHDVTNCNCYSE